MSIIRPLKAPSKPIEDLATLQYPLYVSDKLDGIRCLMHPTLGPVSQKLLPIPNRFVRNYLTTWCSSYLDGELICLGTFNDVQSSIMTETGCPEFEYHVFDTFECPQENYSERYMSLHSLGLNDHRIKILPQHVCYNELELKKYEEYAIKRGCEGVMVRSRYGPYKQGRSTEREGLLLKIVRFETDEAVVVSTEVQMENCNVATQDHNGLTKRSKHQAGMRPKEAVGVLVCDWHGKTLRISAGAAGAARCFQWYHFPEKIIGKTISFQYKPYGMKDLPRTPIFKGIRYDA